MNNLNGGSRARLRQYKSKPGDWRENRWVTPNGLGFNVPHAYAVTRSDDGKRIYADTGYLAHLRDVKQPRHIEHVGWYSDIWADATIAGKVAHISHGRFIAYAVFSDADGITIDARIYDDADDAWIAADRMAQRLAEDSKEYSAAWNAGRRYADNMEEIKDARTEAREIAKASRENSNAKICSVLRGKIKDLRQQVRKLTEENKTLRDGDFCRGDCYLGFYSGNAEMRAAFNDGAGAEVLK